MNFELALKVRDRILAEPGRVDMVFWREQRYGIGSLLGFRYSYLCGTTCCIAGHALEIQGIDFDRNSTTSHRHPTILASKALELTQEEAYLLFLVDVYGEGLDNPYLDLSIRLRQQSPSTIEYAEIVAEAIDRCMIRNGYIAPMPEPEPEPDVLVQVEEMQVEEELVGV